jgi:hypothetical protein
MSKNKSQHSIDDIFIEGAVNGAKKWFGTVADRSNRHEWTPGRDECMFYKALDEKSGGGIANIYYSPMYSFSAEDKIHKGAVISYKKDAILTDGMFNIDKLLTCTVVCPVSCIGMPCVATDGCGSSSCDSESDSTTTQAIKSKIANDLKEFEKQLHSNSTVASIVNTLNIDVSAPILNVPRGARDAGPWSPSISPGDIMAMAKGKDGERYVIVSASVPGSIDELKRAASVIGEGGVCTLDQFIRKWPYYAKMKELAYRNACRLAYEFSCRIYVTIDHTEDYQCRVNMPGCESKPKTARPRWVQYSNCFEFVRNVESHHYHNYHKNLIMGLSKAEEDACPTVYHEGSVDQHNPSCPSNKHGYYVFTGSSSINPFFAHDDKNRTSNPERQRCVVSWHNPKEEFNVFTIEDHDKKAGFAYVPLDMHVRGQKKPRSETEVVTKKKANIGWVHLDPSEESQQNLNDSSMCITSGGELYDDNMYERQDILNYVRKCFGKRATHLPMNTEVFVVV